MRVIQWATGSVGRTTLRRVIDDPDLELVGVYVTNPRKVGRDAGAIAKRPDTGILATDDIAAILALDADVVIHVPLLSIPYDKQNEEVARLLASGKNVVSTNGFFRPDAHGEAYATPLRAACAAGDATLAGMGLNPGFMAERLATTLSGMMMRLDSIRCHEVFDASLTASAPLLFDVMGFDTDPAQTDLTRGSIAATYDRLYAEVFDQVAEALGTRVATIAPAHELTLAPEDMTLTAGTIRKGHVAATCWRWKAVFENGVAMDHSILWTASHALHGESETAHWLVELGGRPNLRMTLELTDPDPAAPPSRPPMDATAATVINALPAVVAAAPGFFKLPTSLPFRSSLR